MHLTSEERKSLTAMILAVPLENWKLLGHNFDGGGQNAENFTYMTTVEEVQIKVIHWMPWWRTYNGIPCSYGRENFTMNLIHVMLNDEAIQAEYLTIELGSLVDQLRAMFKLLTFPETEQKKQAEKSAKEASEEELRKKKLWEKLGIKG